MNKLVKQEAQVFDYVVRGYALTKEEASALLELVNLVTNPKEAMHYETWGARAKKLGITPAKIQLFRRLPEYKAALIDASRVLAAEHCALIVHRMAERALSPLTESPEGAAKLVLETAGAKATAAQTTNIDARSVSVTLESQLRELAQKALGPVVDVVSVAEEKA